MNHTCLLPNLLHAVRLRWFIILINCRGQMYFEELFFTNLSQEAVKSWACVLITFQRQKYDMLIRDCSLDLAYPEVIPDSWKGELMRHTWWKKSRLFWFLFEIKNKGNQYKISKPQGTYSFFSCSIMSTFNINMGENV